MSNQPAITTANTTRNPTRARRSLVSEPEPDSGALPAETQTEPATDESRPAGTEEREERDQQETPASESGSGQDSSTGTVVLP